MKIVNKDEFRKLSKGTVYSLFSPNIINGDLHIKGQTFVDKDGLMDMAFELPLYHDFDCGDPNGEIYSEKNLYEYDYCSVLSWTDTNMIDYDDNQLFAIYNKEEVLELIQELIKAISGMTED